MTEAVLHIIPKSSYASAINQPGLYLFSRLGQHTTNRGYPQPIFIRVRKKYTMVRHYGNGFARLRDQDVTSSKGEAAEENVNIARPIKQFSGVRNLRLQLKELIYCLFSHVT
jgi:hypothetical protein